MHTVVETREYLAATAKAGMSEAERETAVLLLAANPEAGDLLVGGGGVRKVRVPRRGKGKSGGYRVLTYYMATDEPVFLLTALSKTIQSDFSREQVGRLAKIAKAIRDER